MADSKRELSIRLSAEGGAELTDTFRQVGTSGEQAFQQVDKAVESASDKLDQFDHSLRDAALNAGQAVSAIQRQINQSLGIGQSGQSAADAANVFKYAAQAQAQAQIEAMRQVQAEFNQLLGVGQIDSARNAEIAALFGKIEKGASGSAAALSRAGGTYSRFGYIAQEVGFQVGDFATQVASGSGVLRPLIQQGTQLLTVFGPWGAVIGAAGAVVGALATSLLDMKDAEEGAAKGADTYAAALQAADDIARKLRGETQQTVDSLQAERRYRLDLAQAVLDEAEAKIKAAQVDAEQQRVAAEDASARNPEDQGATYAYQAALVRLKDLHAAQDDVILNQRKLVAELRYGGDKLDPFAEQGSDHSNDYYHPTPSSQGSDRANGVRAGETKDIEDQRSALSALIDKMQDENTLLQATGAAREALQRQRAIDAATTEAQADAERDYQAGLRDTEILTSDELKRIQDLAAAHYDLAQAQDAAGAAAKARAQAESEASKQSNADTQELIHFVDQSTDRIGSSLTQAAVQTGNWTDRLRDLGNIGLGVLSEIEQEVIKLSFINPFKNWENGNNSLPTIGDIIGKGLDWLNSGDPAGSLSGGGVRGFADGGVMTSKGPATLPMYRYADGGVAYRPQLALFGEGDDPEAYVPLKGGAIPVRLSMPDRVRAASSAPTVVQAPGVDIQVFNYGNSQVKTQTQQQPDGKQLISLVIGEMAKDVASNGVLGRQLRKTYGLTPQAAVQR